MNTQLYVICSDGKYEDKKGIVPIAIFDDYDTAIRYGARVHSKLGTGVIVSLILNKKLEVTVD